MPRLDMDDVRERAQRSKRASFAMQGVPLDVRNGALKAIAEQLLADAPDIVEANRRDLV
jgi:gamma-glutamyl phosphate reductase